VGERDRQRALKAAEDLAREHGFSLAELTGGSGKVGRAAGGTKRASRTAAAPSAPSEAKYRNPDDATQTWSGRGRRPAWVNEALAQGRALTDLAI
jgi:DNA-binding protein H-NS